MLTGDSRTTAEAVAGVPVANAQKNVDPFCRGNPSSRLPGIVDEKAHVPSRDAVDFFPRRHVFPQPHPMPRGPATSLIKRGAAARRSRIDVFCSAATGTPYGPPSTGILERSRNRPAATPADDSGGFIITVGGLEHIWLRASMRAGIMIQSHQADSPISLQVIEGVLKFTTVSQTLTLRQGQLLTLQTGIQHAVEAVGESAFLLTLAAETPYRVEP
jgi:quercetin dioxygenase-like cupin family protein